MGCTRLSGAIAFSYNVRDVKFLNGLDLASFIKVRQAAAVKQLVQFAVAPRLEILVTPDNRLGLIYAGLKRKYAEEIGAQVTITQLAQAEMPARLKQATADSAIDGLVIQLPLPQPDETDQICRLIPLSKDIDRLNPSGDRETATATAVTWLLAGHGIDLARKKIVIIGCGRLVGAPLLKILQSSGTDVSALAPHDFSAEKIKAADVVVSAAGQPGLIKSAHLAEGAVVVDAGTTVLEGRLTGDVEAAVYGEREDLIITPQKGGLGPVTIAVLFDRLIGNASARAGN